METDNANVIISKTTANVSPQFDGQGEASLAAKPKTSSQRAKEAEQDITVLNPVEAAIAPNSKYDETAGVFYVPNRKMLPSEERKATLALAYGNPDNPFMYNADINTGNYIVGDYTKSSSDIEEERETARSISLAAMDIAEVNRQRQETPLYRQQIDIVPTEPPTFENTKTVKEESKDYDRNLIDLDVSGEGIERTLFQDAMYEVSSFAATSKLNFLYTTSFGRAFTKGVLGLEVFADKAIMAAGLMLSGDVPSKVKDMTDEQAAKALGYDVVDKSIYSEYDLDMKQKFTIAWAQANDIITDTLVELGVERAEDRDLKGVGKYMEAIGGFLGGTGLSGYLCMSARGTATLLFSAMSAADVLENEIEEGARNGGYASEAGRTLAIASSVGFISGLIEKTQGKMLSRWIGHASPVAQEAERRLLRNLESKGLGKKATAFQKNMIQARPWITGEQTVFKKMFEKGWKWELTQEGLEESSQGFFEKVIPDWLGYKGYVDWSEVAHDALYDFAAGFVGAGLLKGGAAFLESRSWKGFRNEVVKNVMQEDPELTKEQANAIVDAWGMQIFHNAMYKKIDVMDHINEVAKDPEKFKQEVAEELERIKSDTGEERKKKDNAAIQAGVKAQTPLFSDRSIIELPLPPQYVREKKESEKKESTKKETISKETILRNTSEEIAREHFKKTGYYPSAVGLPPEAAAKARALRWKLAMENVASLTGADFKKLYQEYVQKQQKRISEMTLQEKEDFRDEQMFNQLVNQDILLKGIDIFVDSYEESINIAKEARDRKKAGDKTPMSKKQMAARHAGGKDLLLMDWLGMPQLGEDGYYHYSKEQREKLAKAYFIYHYDKEFENTSDGASKRLALFKDIENMQMKMLMEMHEQGLLDDQKMIEHFEAFFGKGITTILEPEFLNYSAKNLDAAIEDMRNGANPSKYTSAVVRSLGELIANIKTNPAGEYTLRAYLQAKSRSEKQVLSNLLKGLDMATGNVPVNAEELKQKLEKEVEDIRLKYHSRLKNIGLSEDEAQYGSDMIAGAISALSQNRGMLPKDTEKSLVKIEDFFKNPERLKEKDLTNILKLLDLSEEDEKMLNDFFASKKPFDISNFPLTTSVSGESVPQWLVSAAKRKKKETTLREKSLNFLQELVEKKYLDEKEKTMVDLLQQETSTLKDFRDFLRDEVLRNTDQRFTEKVYDAMRDDRSNAIFEYQYAQEQIAHLNEMLDVIAKPINAEQVRKLMGMKQELERYGYTVQDWGQMDRAYKAMSAASKIIKKYEKDKIKELDNTLHDIFLVGMEMRNAYSRLMNGNEHNGLANILDNAKLDTLEDRQKAIDKIQEELRNAADILENYVLGKNLVSYYGHKEVLLAKLNMPDIESRITAAIMENIGRTGSVENTPKLIDNIFMSVITRTNKNGNTLREIPVEYTQELIRLVSRSATAENISREVHDVLEKIQGKLDNDYKREMAGHIGKVYGSVISNAKSRNSALSYNQRKAISVISENLEKVRTRAFNAWRDATGAKVKNRKGLSETQRKELAEYERNMYFDMAEHRDNMLKDDSGEYQLGIDDELLSWENIDEYTANLALNLLDFYTLQSTPDALPQTYFYAYNNAVLSRAGILTDAARQEQERINIQQEESRHYIEEAAARNKWSTAEIERQIERDGGAGLLHWLKERTVGKGHDESWLRKAEAGLMNLSCDVNTYAKIMLGEKFALKYDLSYKNIEMNNRIEAVDVYAEQVIRSYLGNEADKHTTAIAAFAAECRARKCWGDEEDLISDFNSIGTAGKELADNFKKNKRKQRYKDLIRSTKAELLYLYSVSLNDKGRERLENDYGKGIIEWLRETRSLDAYDRLYARALITARESMYYDVNDTYRHINGLDMGFERMYTPLLYEGDNKYESTDTNSLSWFSGDLTDMENETKTRTFTEKRFQQVSPDTHLKVLDLFNVHEKYVRDAAMLIHVTPTVNEILTTVFNTQIKEGEYAGLKIADVLEEGYGKDTVKNWLRLLNYNRGIRPKSYSAFNPVLKTVVRSTGVSHVANLAIAARQTFSAVYMCYDVPYKFMAEKFAEGLSSPKKTWEQMMRDCPDIANRLKGAFPDAFVQSGGRSLEEMFAKLVHIPFNQKKFDNALLILNRYGDAASIVYGGYVYREWLKTQVKDDGRTYTDEELNRMVAIRFSQTQQSANASELIPMQINPKTMFSCYALAFRSGSLAQIKVAMTEFRKFLESGEIRPLANSVLLLLISAMLQRFGQDPMGMTEAIYSLFQSEDRAYIGDKYRYENLVRPLILSGAQWNWGLEFAVSQISDAIARNGWKGQKVPHFSDGIMYLEEPMKGFEKVIKAYTKKDWEGVFWGAFQMLQSFTSVPLGYAKRIKKGFEDISDDKTLRGSLRIFGISDTNAEKVRYYRYFDTNRFYPHRRNRTTYKDSMSRAIAYAEDRSAFDFPKSVPSTPGIYLLRKLGMDTLKISDELTFESFTHTDVPGLQETNRKEAKRYKTQIEKKLIPFAQNVINAAGDKITITSGFRGEDVNKAVGGTKNSLHPYGMAFDFVAANGTGEQQNENTIVIFNKLLRAILDGSMPEFGNLIIEKQVNNTYNIHVDMADKTQTISYLEYKKGKKQSYPRKYPKGVDTRLIDKIVKERFARNANGGRKK